MPRIIECDLYNCRKFLRFLFTQKHPLFLQKSSTFSSPKRTSPALFFREILLFFAEQKPIWNHRVTQLVLVALGKNALFLPTLLARKSSLPHHGRDEGPIAQTHDGRDIDGVEELARFFLRQDRRLAFPDGVFRAPDRRRRVGGHDLADDRQSKSIRIAARCCLTDGLASRAVSCSI